MKPITTLAVLERTIGLRHKEVAALVGCAEVTIKKIARKKLPLADDMAMKIAQQFGVKIECLFCDPVSPLLNYRGKPYTKTDYEKRQAKLDGERFNPTDPATVQWQFANSTAKVAATLLRAYQDGKFELYAWKLKAALSDVFGELSGDGVDHNGILGKVFQCRQDKKFKTRPDLEPILKAWESGFKRARKKAGK